MSSRRSGDLPWSLGSAREVPPWVLAGPLVSRVAALIAQMTRTFVPTTVEREMPRGTVDWNCYGLAGHSHRGGGYFFPVLVFRIEEPSDLVAALRWTLRRVGEDLSEASDSGRATTDGADRGPSPGARTWSGTRRPGGLVDLVPPSIGPEWLRLAVEAMAWFVVMSAGWAARDRSTAYLGPFP